MINGAKSEKAQVSFGVPQGSLIGHDFFSPNVNDMPEKIKQGGEVDLFANDSTAIKNWPEEMTKGTQWAQLYVWTKLRNIIACPSPCT